jgi:hypothetical protein
MAKEKEMSPEDRLRAAMDLIKVLATPQRKLAVAGQVRATFHYNSRGELCKAQVEDDLQIT